MHIMNLHILTTLIHSSIIKFHHTEMQMNNKLLIFIIYWETHAPLWNSVWMCSLAPNRL